MVTAERIEQIKKEIAAGMYETRDKLEVTIDRLKAALERHPDEDPRA